MYSVAERREQNRTEQLLNDVGFGELQLKSHVIAQWLPMASGIDYKVEQIII